MNIIVDADACPVVIKEILFKAALRTKIPLLLVANHAMRIPAGTNIQFLQVESGFDIADNEIVARVNENDLVVTSDIPLAAEIIDKIGRKEVHVVSPRGEVFDKQNIRGRLNTRDFMETMRSSGIQTGGPPPLGQRERKAFAAYLDKYLSAYKP